MRKMSGYRIGWAAQVVLASLCSVFAGAGGGAQPYNVALVSRLPGHFEAVQVVGRYAYISENASFPGILRIFDVSNPSSPVELGSLRLPSWVWGVHVRDGLAYVANGDAGLRIVDVRNPAAPTLSGSYATAGTAVDVFVSGALAYIASAYGLQIVDVTNPSSPTLRGSYHTPGFAAEVFVSGGLAFIADETNLQIVDVTNPSSPFRRSSYNLGLGRMIRNVFVSKSVAYVTVTTSTAVVWNPYARLLAIDAANPAAPSLLGSYGAKGAGAGIYVSGGLAYVLLGVGLEIFYIGNPSLPTLRGFYPCAEGLSPGVGEVLVSGDLVYVADGHDLLILQFTGRPAQASTYWQLYR